MDKAIQDNTELRDDELYALLDKAWETERLCVSEELIQKTLKRAAEETDTKVISFESVAKRKFSPMKYVGVAVAAVFVVVLGVNVFGNGGFFANKAQMEATADRSGYKADGAEAYERSEASIAMGNGADSDDGRWHYSKSMENAGVLADAADEAEAFDSAVGIKEEAGMSGTTEILSEKTVDALCAVGADPVSDTAECWAFVDNEIVWDTELLNCLKAGAVFEKEFPYSGTYQYVLQCNDGTRKILECREPLDLVVRMETKQGMLWGLFGANVFFVME